jgi:hypothetical protein
MGIGIWQGMRALEGGKEWATELSRGNCELLEETLRFVPALLLSNHAIPFPPSLLNAQWATQPGATFSTIAFHLPPHCALRELSLSSQRPLCLPSASLARCTALRLAARRAYLGLPMRPGAPWLDVDALAARFAEVQGAACGCSVIVRVCLRSALPCAGCLPGLSPAGLAGLSAQRAKQGRLLGERSPAGRCTLHHLHTWHGRHLASHLSTLASPPLPVQFMLGSPLEVIEVTATRCFVFQPVQGGLVGWMGWEGGWGQCASVCGVRVCLTWLSMCCAAQPSVHAV